MKKWKRYAAGLLLLTGWSSQVHAQAVVPVAPVAAVPVAPVAAPAAAPANLWSFFCMTPEQKAVMDPYVAGLPDEVARKHADRYRQAFEMFLRHRDVIGRVTVWGPHDGDSWLNNFPIRGRTDYPLLFNRQGQPKPAFYAVRRAAEAVVPQ